MPAFEYEAEDAAGKLVEGIVESATVAEAAATLESRGLALKSIRRADTPERAGRPAGLEDAVQRVIEQGEVILGPLRAYAGEHPIPARRKALRQVVASIDSGDTTLAVDRAIAQPEAWSAVLAAATDADGGFLRGLVRRGRVEPAARNPRLALVAYPVGVVVLAFAVLWPLAALVMPTFRSLFNEFGLDLPAVTLLVLNLSGWFSNYGVVLLGASLVALVLWWMWPAWAPPAWRQLDRRGPGRWPLGLSATQTRLRSIADLVEAGVDPDDAVRLCHRGDGAWRPAAAHGLRADADKAVNPSLLRDLADCYAERSARRASWFVSLSGPVAILLIGFVIGFVAISLLLPLVTLVEGLT